MKLLIQYACIYASVNQKRGTGCCYRKGHVTWRNFCCEFQRNFWYGAMHFFHSAGDDASGGQISNQTKQIF